MVYQKDAKPCRGGCGKLMRNSSGYCKQCYSFVPKRVRRANGERQRRTWDELFGPDDDPGPSEQEIEQTIAEQLSKPLPGWWDNSEHRTDIRESDDIPGIRVVHVRAVDGRVNRRQPFLW